MLSLLLTRPRAQSEAFAAALAARLPGRFRPVISPLLIITFRDARPDLEGVAALAFTSANGVAAFAARCPECALPAYCVGASTAEAARAAGFAAQSADGNAAALAALIARDQPGAVLHVRGAHVAADLPALLRARGLPAHDIVLYDQRPAAPSADARALGEAGRLDAIAIFSPRSSHLLAEAARGWDLARTTTIAISAAADAPLAPLRASRRLVAEHPSRDGMIAALARL